MTMFKGCTVHIVTIILPFLISRISGEYISSGRVKLDGID